MKILVINGPNLNFLGIREKNIYGTQDYNYLLKLLQEKGEQTDTQITVFQSNHEGAIIDRLQEAYFDGTQGIVINPGSLHPLQLRHPRRPLQHNRPQSRNPHIRHRQPRRIPQNLRHRPRLPQTNLRPGPRRLPPGHRLYPLYLKQSQFRPYIPHAFFWPAKTAFFPGPKAPWMRGGSGHAEIPVRGVINSPVLRLCPLQP